MARHKMVQNNTSEGVLLSLNADIIGIMKRDNVHSQYEDITQLMLIIRTCIKNFELTINICKDNIWELVDKIINACFGSLIRQYR